MAELTREQRMDLLMLCMKQAFLPLWKDVDAWLAGESLPLEANMASEIKVGCKVDWHNGVWGCSGADVLCVYGSRLWLKDVTGETFEAEARACKLAPKPFATVESGIVVMGGKFMIHPMNTAEFVAKTINEAVAAVDTAPKPG